MRAGPKPQKKPALKMTKSLNWPKNVAMWWLYAAIAKPVPRLAAGSTFAVAAPMLTVAAEAMVDPACNSRVSAIICRRASLTFAGEQFSVVSGGIACIAVTGILVAAMPAFLKYDGRHPVP